MDVLQRWLGLPESLPTSFDATHGWTLSWLLPILATLIALGYAWLARHGEAPWTAKARRTLGAALALAALLSVPVYADFGIFRYGTYFNEWDLYHYYLGSKYAPELGYQKLYSATLIADAETGQKFAHPSGHIRDLSNLQFVSVEQVLAEREAVMARFEPERWREFVADVGFFKRHLSQAKWSTLLQDHGYNGTPAWSALVGGLFSRHLSVRDPLQRALLVGLDPLLLLVSFGVLLRVFGFRAAALCAVFVGTHYLLSWGHLKGCLLRTDFALCSVMAVAMVKAERYRTAGVLMGLATLSRLFPVVLLVGLGVHGLATLIRQRRLDRQLLSMLASFAATLAGASLLAVAYGGQTSLWGEWLPKILDHYGSLVHWNMGYKAIMGADWATGVPVLVDWSQVLSEEPELLAVQRALVPFTQLIIALPALYFAHALRRWEAMAFSFLFFFVFIQTTYYYYLFLLVPMLFFAANVDELPRALGAGLFLLTGALGYALFSGVDALSSLVMFRGWKQFYPTYYFMSWFVGLGCAYMLVLAGLIAYRKVRAERDDGPVEGTVSNGIAVP